MMRHKDYFRFVSLRSTTPLLSGDLQNVSLIRHFVPRWLVPHSLWSSAPHTEGRRAAPLQDCPDDHRQHAAPPRPRQGLGTHRHSNGRTSIRLRCVHEHIRSSSTARAQGARWFGGWHPRVPEEPTHARLGRRGGRGRGRPRLLPRVRGPRLGYVRASVLSPPPPPREVASA